MNRSLWIGIVVTIALFGALAAFFYFKYIKVEKQYLYTAIPETAAYILVADNGKEGMNELYQTEMWQLLLQNTETADLVKLIREYDSLIQQTAVGGSELALSMHVVRNKAEWLLVTHLPDHSQPTDIIGILNQKAAFKIKNRSYEGAKFFDVLDKANNYRGVFAVYDKYLFYSTTGLLAESAVRKLKYNIHSQTDELISLQSFEDKNALFRIFINYRQLPALYDAVSKHNDTDNPLLPLQNLANWSMLNVNLNKNQFVMKGITLTDDTVSQFLDLFRNQHPVAFDEINRFIPAQSAFLLRMGFSDYTKFKTDLDEYHERTGRFQLLKAKEDSINKLYQIDLSAIIPHIGKQVVLGAFAQSTGIASFAAIRINSPTAFANLITGFENQIRKRASVDSLQQSFVHKGYTCTALPFGAFFENYFGNSFKYISTPYVALVEDVLYVAASQPILQNLIDQYEARNTLNSDQLFVQIKSQSGPTSNLGLYINTIQAYSIPLSIVNPVIYSHLNRNDNLYKKYSAFHLQFASSNEREFYTQLSVQLQPDFEENQRMIWQVKMDTTAVAEPWFVFNKDEQLYDIMVQDVKNTLYYITNAGELKWKVKMSGRILGNIHTVVYHPSGKWGYLFNTSKSVSLIDINGVNVFGYPVQLPGNATSSLLLTDFYGDSSYNYFIPLDNKRVMGYALTGKALLGWNPKTTEDKLLCLNTFTFDNQPYLYATGQNASLYIWKPDGSQINHTIPKGYNHELSSDKVQLTDTTKTSLTQYVLKSDLTVTDAKVLLHTDSAKLDYNGLFVTTTDSKGVMLYSNTGKLISGPVPSTRFYVNQGSATVLQFDSLQQQLYAYYDFVSDKSFPIQASGAGTIGYIMNDGVRYVVVPAANNNLALFRLK
jgi:hypothetical protein